MESAPSVVLHTDKHERNSNLLFKGCEHALSAISLMFLSFVISSDVYKVPQKPAMFPNIKTDVVIILVEMHLSCFFLSNYRAAYLF